MRVRRDRWISVSEVADHLAKTFSRVAKMKRKRRTEYARRLVRRVEERDEVSYSKWVGARLYVSVTALEALLPANFETVSQLEANLSELNQQHRDLRRQVNGQGARIRQQDQRISKVEAKTALFQHFVTKMAEIEGCTMAAPRPHTRG